MYWLRPWPMVRCPRCFKPREPYLEDNTCRVCAFALARAKRLAQEELDTLKAGP